jgi:hypothetical protein
LENKPKIYNGIECAAQWQIAAGNLHQLSNDEYEIKLAFSSVCDRCDRKFAKLFKFNNNDLDIVHMICHACIADMGSEGILNFLHEQEKKMNQE